MHELVVLCDRHFSVGDGDGELFMGFGRDTTEVY
jgi:hypothetical protein